MHFGYWRPGPNPLRREPMLHELNLQALARLRLPLDRPARLADLGGGTGATARAAVAACPNLRVDSVTLVPLQVAMGAANRSAARGSAVTMHCVDFAASRLPAGQYDGVCLIESAGHADGATNAGVLREAYRLLRLGGLLVMVDALLVGALPRRGLLAAVTAAIYRRWCASWAIPEMGRLDLLPQRRSVLRYGALTTVKPLDSAS